MVQSNLQPSFFINSDAEEEACDPVGRRLWRKGSRARCCGELVGESLVGEEMEGAGMKSENEQKTKSRCQEYFCGRKFAENGDTIQNYICGNPYMLSLT